MISTTLRRHLYKVYLISLHSASVEVSEKIENEENFISTDKNSFFRCKKEQNSNRKEQNYHIW